MPKQSHQVIKSMLSKFAPDGLFLLSEVAEKLRVRESYLLEMIKAGKLKGFQIDGRWFVEEKWLDKFRASVREALVKEAEGHRLLMNRDKKWHRPMNVVDNFSSFEELKPAGSAVWQFSVYAMVLAFAITGVSFTSVALWPAYQYRQEIGRTLLMAVDNFYGAPSRIAQDLTNEKIKDERFTEKFAPLLGLPLKGKVAGAVEFEQ